jgi:hypothetical protein
VGLDETKSTSRWRVTGPMFVKDRNGQVLFFVMGMRFRGYIVPDGEREWVLRDAIVRFKKMEASFAQFVAPVGAFSALLLGGRYSNFALTVLTITLVAAAIGRVLQRRWCFGGLVVGLDRVEPLDVVGRRIGLTLFSLITAAYCSFVLWRILQAFQLNSF